jgi:hypothetical protein
MILTGVVLFFLVGTVLILSVMNDWSFVPKDSVHCQAIAAPPASEVMIAINDQSVAGR